MCYLSYVRPFREEYLNKILVINEFFLVVEAGFMVLFCTPFGTTDMDISYCTFILYLTFHSINCNARSLSLDSYHSAHSRHSNLLIE